jgi:lipopolysaccharide export system protein LptC
LATYDKIYFRVINFLKIALPVIGVGLIIAMFILSRDQVSKAVLPFDKNKFEHELAKQQINQLYYSGQTDAGDELALSAQAAAESLEGQDKLEMKSVSATVKTKYGLEINATAQFGEYLYSEKLLKMSGSVLISSSTGYQLSTPALLVSTDGTYIRGVGPVEGFSPMGKIQAGKIEIKRENANAPMQLWFSEKVTIDYEPKEI